MTVSLAINTDNAAFQPDPAPEIARILRKIADRVEAGLSDYGHLTILDANGNTVGLFEVKDAS